MFRRILLIALWCCLLSSSSFAIPLIVDTVTGEQPLLHELLWLPDPEGSLSIETASEPQIQGKFLSLRYGFPVKAAGPVWLKLSLVKAQRPALSSRQQTVDRELSINFGKFPGGPAQIFMRENGQGVIAHTHWTETKVGVDENFTIPALGSSPLTLFIRFSETPALWFHPSIEPLEQISAHMLPLDSILKGFFMVACAVCLLRAIKEQTVWRFWSALFILFVLLALLLPLPLLNARFSYQDLLPLLAPGLALLLLPHLGRALLETHKTAPVQDMFLAGFSVVGVLVALSPLIPNYAWLMRLFPLWPLLLFPLLPICFWALQDKRSGALAFTGICTMPFMGSLLTFFSIDALMPHPMAVQGSYWGLAVGSLGLALTSGPRRRKTSLNQESHASLLLPASAAGSFPDGGSETAGIAAALPEVKDMEKQKSSEESNKAIPSFMDILPDKVEDPKSQDPLEILSSSQDKDSGASANKEKNQAASGTPHPVLAGEPKKERADPVSAPPVDADLQARQMIRANAVPSLFHLPEQAEQAPALFFEKHSRNHNLLPIGLALGPQSFAQNGSGADTLSIYFDAVASLLHSIPPSNGDKRSGAELPSPASATASAEKKAIQEKPGSRPFERADHHGKAEASSKENGSGGAGSSQASQATKENFIAAQPQADLAASSSKNKAVPLKDSTGQSRQGIADGRILPVPPVRLQEKNDNNLPQVISSSPAAPATQPDSGKRQRLSPLPSLSYQGEGASMPTDIAPPFDLHAQKTRLPFSILKLQQEINQELGILLKKKGIIFSWVIDPRLPLNVYGNEKPLRSILKKLLTSAIELTDAGFVLLTLRSKAVPEKKQIILTFTITDTGPQVRPEKLHEEALAYVKEEGGSFTYEYTDLNGPSSTLIVPLFSTAATVQDIELHQKPVFIASSIAQKVTPDKNGGPIKTLKNDDPEPMPEPQAQAKKNQKVLPEVLADKSAAAQDLILVGDTTISNLRLIAHYLQQEQLSYQNSQEKVSLAALYKKNCPCGLLIVDADMPEDKLLKTLQQIREFELERTISPAPVLALVSHDGQTERMLAMGCSRTLLKPYSRDEFIQTVRSCLDKETVGKEDEKSLLPAETSSSASSLSRSPEAYIQKLLDGSLGSSRAVPIVDESAGPEDVGVIAPQNETAKSLAGPESEQPHQAPSLLSAQGLTEFKEPEKIRSREKKAPPPSPELSKQASVNPPRDISNAVTAHGANGSEQAKKNEETQQRTLLSLPGLDDESINKALLPLAPGLVQALRSAMEDCAKGVQKQDLPLVRQALEQIIAQSHAFGLQKLEKVASCIERAAAADDAEAVGILHQDLQTVILRHIDSIERCYNLYLHYNKQEPH